MFRTAIHAIGLDREREAAPPRRPGWRYLIGDTVILGPETPSWHPRHLGRALTVRGPWKVTAVAVVGPDWQGVKIPGRREWGDFLGGMSWRRYGPVAVCRYRIRGSWRSDRAFRRIMTESS